MKERGGANGHFYSHRNRSAFGLLCLSSAFVMGLLWLQGYQVQVNVARIRSSPTAGGDTVVSSAELVVLGSTKSTARDKPVDKQANQEALNKLLFSVQRDLFDHLMSTVRGKALPNNNGGFNLPPIACPAERIAIVGSSYARSLSFSLSTALTGLPYPAVSDPPETTDEVVIPNFKTPSPMMHSRYSNRMIPQVCSSHTKEETNSCHLREYLEFLQPNHHTVCRYPYDTGVATELCGYPYMKRWALSPGMYHAVTSVPINETIPNLQTAPFTQRSRTQMYYLFKTYTYSPNVDHHALRNVQNYQPTVLFLDLTLWGCRDPRALEAAPPFLLPGDEARDCDTDFYNAVTHWENGLDVKHHLDGVTILHFIDSENQPPEELQALQRVIDELQRTSPRMHLLIDKADILRLIPEQMRSVLGHGYYGMATDIWARAALTVLCQNGV